MIYSLKIDTALWKKKFYYYFFLELFLYHFLKEVIRVCNQKKDWGFWIGENYHEHYIGSAERRQSLFTPLNTGPDLVATPLGHLDDLSFFRHLFSKLILFILNGQVRLKAMLPFPFKNSNLLSFLCQFLLELSQHLSVFWNTSVQHTKLLFGFPILG